MVHLHEGLVPHPGVIRDSRVVTSHEVAALRYAPRRGVGAELPCPPIDGLAVDEQAAGLELHAVTRYTHHTLEQPGARVP